MKNHYPRIRRRTYEEEKLRQATFPRNPNNTAYVAWVCAMVDSGQDRETEDSDD